MDEIKSVTPVKPGRSLVRRKARNMYGDEEEEICQRDLTFTSPDCKIKPEMINCERAFKTAVKRASSGFKSTEKPS